MASFLYWLGRSAFHRRRWVAAAWLAVLAAALCGAAALSEPRQDSFSIPGTQSEEAIDVLAGRFPQTSAGGATARVVFAAPDGKTLRDPVYRRVIDTAVNRHCAEARPSRSSSEQSPARRCASCTKESRWGRQRSSSWR
jgi:RND superfamily putative drug exporter